MKENEIVQHFKLNNLGVCYDFVANYISSPRCNMNSLDVIYYIFNNFERDDRFAISQSVLYESFWEPFEGVRNFTDNLGNELQNEEKQFGLKR